MPKTGLYFAYGRDLNENDLAGWCERKGLAYPLAGKAMNAYLADRRLRWLTYGTAGGGGVFDIDFCLGQALPGVVYRVREGGWAVLDQRQGVPGRRRDEEVTVLSPDGRFHRARTYRWRGEQRDVPDGTALRDDMDLIEEGLRRHGLDRRMHHAVAAGGTPPWTIDQLFVYGTLMEGEPRHGLLRNWTNGFGRGKAKTQGILYDSGRGYPCLVIVEGGMQWVHGELYTLIDPGRAFADLDPEEGYLPLQPERSAFRRAVIKVVTEDHRTVTAWTYLYRGYTAPLKIIPSGDWRHGG
ncbi:MAG TPA: gamma-glutamylcyclotransferase [Syntrophales bacterium]|nr:gamma-glutamylcyclotransferase [Syntrophales bacterium]